VTALSNHVPDPRLVTVYAERGDSPLHRINPWTKVGVLGALVLAVTVVDRLAVLVAIYAILLGLYGIAGLPYRRLLGWYTVPLVFVLSVGGPIAVLEPGTPIGGALSTPIGSLSITWAGLALFVELGSRSLAVVTFVLTASMTTKYAHVALLLHRLLPRPIDQIALLTYRFTFVLLETLEGLMTAARARGATLSEFWTNRRLYARILGVTVLGAVERAERLVGAMEARGYDGDLSLYGDVPRPPPAELLAVAGCYVALLAYVVLDAGWVSG
jgi:cobalt/nickel transport system permease protein